jgi:hypothetical protein
VWMRVKMKKKWEESTQENRSERDSANIHLRWIEWVTNCKRNFDYISSTHTQFVSFFCAI